MKKIKFKSLFILSLFSLFSLALHGFAKLPAQYMDLDESTKAFRSYQDVSSLDILVPTVVELPLENDYLERYDFLLVDKTTNQAEPYYFQQETYSNNVPVGISSVPAVSNLSRVNDNNASTYAQFDLPEEGQGQVKIIISSSEVINSSFLNILLDRNVALPNRINIIAKVDGLSKIVLSQSAVTSQGVRFPKTSSNYWEIDLTYSQPLRITELSLNQEDLTITKNRSVRWLAQVNHSYRVYMDPDSQVNVYTGESGNLRADEGVLVLDKKSTLPNPTYKPADIDNDGVKDTIDNCVSVANNNQLDTDINGRGDACDDFDRDGILNYQDNCRDNPNRYQQDSDADGIGDACDLEESRITEKHAWLPWLGIVFAVVVIVVLFFITARSSKSRN